MNVTVYKQLVSALILFILFTGCRNPDPLFYNAETHAIQLCNGNSINKFIIKNKEYAYFFERKVQSNSKHIFADHLSSDDYIIVPIEPAKHFDPLNIDDKKDTMSNLNLKANLEYVLRSYFGGSGMLKDSFELNFKVDKLGSIYWSSRNKCF